MFGHILVGVGGRRRRGFPGQSLVGPRFGAHQQPPVGLRGGASPIRFQAQQTTGVCLQPEHIPVSILAASKIGGQDPLFRFAVKALLMDQPEKNHGRKLKLQVEWARLVLGAEPGPHRKIKSLVPGGLGQGQDPEKGLQMTARLGAHQLALAPGRIPRGGFGGPHRRPGQPRGSIGAGGARGDRQTRGRQHRRRKSDLIR